MPSGCFSQSRHHGTSLKRFWRPEPGMFRVADVWKLLDRRILHHTLLHETLCGIVAWTSGPLLTTSPYVDASPLPHGEPAQFREGVQANQNVWVLSEVSGKYGEWELHTDHSCTVSLEWVVCPWNDTFGSSTLRFFTSFHLSTKCWTISKTAGPHSVICT